MPRYFKALTLTKPNGGVHPAVIVDDVPLRKFKPDDPFTPKAYDGLTDESSYSHYAWAFLRRNRFYQSMLDRRSDDDDLALWGYKPSPESPEMFGLMEEKPYTQSHDEGQPVRWWGIHSFVENLTNDDLQPPRIRDKREFKSVQVQIVFDIDALQGPDMSIASLQTDIARAFLVEKATAAGFHTEDMNAKQKPQDKFKARLRNLLCVADLMSPQMMSTNGGPSIATWATGTAQPSIQEIGKHLTDAGVEKNSSAASALGSEAFTTIYSWVFLKWLQFDNWSDNLDEIRKRNQVAQNIAMQRRKVRQELAQKSASTK
jgi:hypothetical protein